MYLLPHTLAPLGEFAKSPAQAWPGCPLHNYEMVHLVCQPDGSFIATAGNGHAVVSVSGLMPERSMAPHPCVLDKNGERFPYGPGETILVPNKTWAKYFERAAACVRNAPTMELRAVAVSRESGIAKFRATNGVARAEDAAFYPESDDPLLPGTFTPAAPRARDGFALDYELLRNCIDTMAACLGKPITLKFTTHGPERAVVINATNPAGLRATAVIAVVKNRVLEPVPGEPTYADLQKQIDELTERLAVYESK